MNKKDYEDRLLSLIKTPEDLSEIILEGISSEDFIMRREIFDFISSYYNKYNAIPSKDIVEATFTDFAVLEDIEAKEMTFFIDEIKKSSVRAKAINLLNKGADLVLKDPYGAIDYMVSKLSHLQKINTYSRSYTDKEALKRFDLFESNKLKMKKGIQVGLKTGLSVFDDKLIGWNPGNLISIIGRPGIGKSWMLLYCGSAAYVDGKKIIFLSPEMSVQEVEFRWDTVVSHFFGKTISNEELVLGRANSKHYKEWLESVQIRSDWLTMDSNQGRPFTIPSIQAIVDEFSPDLVCIDGFLLIGGTGGDKGWEVMKELAYGLKTIAQNNKVVILVTSQAGRDAAKSMPELHQVYMGDAIAQASDVVITMTDDDNEPNIRYISIPKRRGLKGSSKRIKIDFDVDRGIIGV